MKRVAPAMIARHADARAPLLERHARRDVAVLVEEGVLQGGHGCSFVGFFVRSCNLDQRADGTRAVWRISARAAGERPAMRAMARSEGRSPRYPRTTTVCGFPFLQPRYVRTLI